ncbi:hypothetical protein QAD02_002892 [Eretmocerus hayati]|uniref:Uncharacterized protein n=1 Tax=Eretmocerus hayati TaxID=131215 RepID=A0ACC2NKB8_9HYME|nr:hypothetical protein QAD02_002892 [Eretmocerus hayati]
MFGTRTETGNATIPDTGENDLEDLCFDKGRNGHGQKRIVLLISPTRTETGNALILKTGKTGLEDFCSDTGRDGHGRKWTELDIFHTRAKTGVKICAFRRVGTDTDENEQRFSFFPHGQIRVMLS